MSATVMARSTLHELFPIEFSAGSFIFFVYLKSTNLSPLRDFEVRVPCARAHLYLVCTQIFSAKLIKKIVWGFSEWDSWVQPCKIFVFTPALASQGHLISRRNTYWRQEEATKYFRSYCKSWVNLSSSVFQVAFRWIFTNVHPTVGCYVL